MDSVLNLLKEEINATEEALHDLAKWKLGVTAALGAAAFGLAKDGSPNYRLVLLIPFVCAYVDLYAYQYDLRIRVLARFLTENPADGGLLKKYEDFCEGLRPKSVFSLGNMAGFGASLGASACGPIFYIAQHWRDANLYNLLVIHAAAGIIWAVGVGLIVYLWWYSRREIGKVSEGNGSNKSAPTAQEPGARSLC